MDISDLYGTRGREAAGIAANLATSFWMREIDHRSLPLEQEVDHPVFGKVTQFNVHSGTRFVVYAAVMPPDPKDGPMPPGIELAWCASEIFPEGELGTIALPPSFEGIVERSMGFLEEITKEEFLQAADDGYKNSLNTV